MAWATACRIGLAGGGEIVDRDATDIAVSCPFCLTMLEDGMKELGEDES